MVAGPPGAPTVLLLHGWTATADLNWFQCYSALARHVGVIAVDHRGHGRGIRSVRRFRLADCADDAMAVCTALGVDRMIPVGYSMGGPIAQLCWHRHRNRVSGLVLGATAAYFAASRAERATFLGLTGLGALARITPPATRAKITEQLYLSRRTNWGDWASGETARHDWRVIAEAGGAIGRYDARSWLAEVDVPTSVVITTADTVVPVERQRALAAAIPGAETLLVNGDHGSVATDPAFVPVLVRAVQSVVRRTAQAGHG